MNKLLRLMAVGVGLAALLADAPRAQAEQVQSGINTTTPSWATNLAPTVLGSAVSNTTSVIPIWAGRGLALENKGNASAGTAPVYYWIHTSVDGTNPSTLPWAIWTITPTATTDARAHTNWSAATLAGFRALIISAQSNSAANTVYYTNKGLMISRPNQ